ncbi:flagellar basal body L-ring protein FlgH [Steroidobacter sp.]|uniref:flagellar basal body L-ring protein FlgH n=1 Tax=Steroidobacter sp. TaxID=1978227 RepID=UPI001A4C5E66|nr:flagellar basal body L-ring protein FlgH [Steroidobacter sp.]MBL8266920.1 flagellar basal body L-ring protein FlgH [Steroidobacter sp.]
MSTVRNLFLVVAAALTLSGCVSAPKEPDYAATWPDPAPSSESANGAIYQVGHDVALFENSVARRVGDTLMIKLNETTTASKSSSTTTAKKTSAALPSPTIAGRPVTVNGTPILETSIDSNSSFGGSGDSKQSNRLVGDVTVTVAQRLPNGNLLVRGQKWITINQGREYVRIQGIVRPIDIDPDNSISSLKVADAQIAYGGKGALADASTPGLLARFFNAPWLPF